MVQTAETASLLLLEVRWLLITLQTAAWQCIDKPGPLQPWAHDELVPALDGFF